MGYGNKDDYYPIVLIPEKILDILENGIEDWDVTIPKPKTEALPVKPSKPSHTITILKKKFIWKSIWNMLVGFFFGVFDVGLLSFVLTGSVFMVGMLGEFHFINAEFMGWWILIISILTVITAFVVVFNETQWFKIVKIYIPKTQNEVRKDELKYEMQIELFNVKCQEINYRNQQVIQDYNANYSNKLYWAKFGLFYDTVSPKVSYEESSEKARKGTSEAYFAEKLIAEFGDAIKVDQVTEDGIYFPDFIYECPDTGLLIDIEIDEPYTLNERKPIHYVGCGDENRNEYFVSNNWCVIRFNERQIVKHADACVASLKGFTSQLKYSNCSNNTCIGFSFRPDDSVIKTWEDMEMETMMEKRWKKKKARKWAKKALREVYLEEAGLI